jgi:hypothetical protein
VREVPYAVHPMLQLALTLTVPAALLGALWLGVQLVRWEKQKPADAASALLTLYASYELDDGTSAPHPPHDD